MLAAGLASGSRAGAVLLLAEAGVILWLISAAARGSKIRDVAAAPGGSGGSRHLFGRFAEKDPCRYRREIAASTVHMIRTIRGAAPGSAPTPMSIRPTQLSILAPGRARA